MPRVINQNTTYADKLIKLIPGEVVAPYLAIRNLVIDDPINRELTLLISIIVLAALIPFYLRIVHEIKNLTQVIVTLISFFVWVFSVSVGEVSSIPIPPLWGAVVVILWTSLIPLFPFGDGSIE